METTFSHTYGSDVAPVFGFCFIGVIVLISLAINILYVIAFCKIFGKAGYPWALGLLMFIPIANLIMPLVLGFGDWPALRELKACRQRQTSATPSASPPQG